MQTSFALRRFNNFLSVVVVLVALYIAAGPFLPLLGWQLGSPGPASVPAAPRGAPIPKENLLIIPRLKMREAINDGPTQYELSKGVWLIPHTSTPDKGSNTVMAGHRFTYAGPAVFYFLDRIQVKDRITIDWHQKEYIYQVKDIKVVPPTEVSIQNASPKPMLTLYTCTPLITAKNRLIIQAPLVREKS